MGLVVWIGVLGFLLVECVAFDSVTQRDREFAATRLTRVAFGSCAKLGQHEDVFDTIRRQQPQVFVLAGDAVYNDVKLGPIPGMFRPASIATMRDNFKARREGAAFKRLAESAHVLAVWDDHDFGLNDAGGELPFKEASREVFLEFAREPKDSPLWRRNGIFASHSFDGGRVKVVLLDVRFNRSENGVLGEEQWQWLEKELVEDSHEIKLLVSPIQVFMFDRPLQEKFSQHWPSYERLAAMINRANGVIVLSGDVHMSSFLRSDCGLSYNVTEFTSSGLTHTILDNAFTRLAAPFVQTWFRSRFELGSTVIKRSFGVVDIDWDARMVNLSMKDAENGETLQELRLEIDSLKPGKRLPSFSECGHFGGRRFTMHWSEVVRVGTFFSAIFGVGLGILMYCQCANARLARQRKHQKKGE